MLAVLAARKQLMEARGLSHDFKSTSFGQLLLYARVRLPQRPKRGRFGCLKNIVTSGL